MAAKYTEGVGRRKEAIARVRLVKGKGEWTINDRTIADYFPLENLRKTTQEALSLTEKDKAYDVSVKVAGGGIKAQAEAIRLGSARALQTNDAELRAPLKAAGFLTRDARVVERKKFGLKKARKSSQWSKR